jgi:tRNA(Ile)-lysidine synthase
MALYKRFKQFVTDKDLLSSEQTVLVAVSGGLDSMVLLHLLSNMHPGRLGVAHANFGLRGADSDADEFFVRTAAASLGIPFFSMTFNTAARAREKGISIQMAARELRYAWFESLAEDAGFDRIATAHHLDDQVETALLHLIRGTGLRGLAGMPLMRGPYIRPLLFARRRELEDYARTEALLWREDASNAEDAYLRNKVRHHLMPLLTDMNPNFVDTTARSMERIRDASDNLRALLDRFVQPSFHGEGQLIWDKKTLEALPGRQQALAHVLSPFGFDAEQVRQLSEGWQDVGKIWQSGTGVRLLNDREQLVLDRQAPSRAVNLLIAPDDLMVRLPDGKALLFMPADGYSAPSDGLQAICMPVQQLVYPLHIRSWQPGDRFQPFGMGGKFVKVQDLLTNRKVSRMDKENTLLLVNGNGEIIWVIGHRSDERYRVGEESSVVRVALAGAQ